MPATIITTTTTTCQKRQSRFKTFLNEHCHIVDFLSASLTICLCLVILLPRVHESFLPPDNHDHDTDHPDSLDPALNGPVTNLSQLVAASSAPPPQPTELLQEAPEQPPDDHAHHQHHHHHSHRFPTGEMLICIGFFVFYCAGLGLARPQVTNADQDLYLARRRKQSTSCCTSSRCPAGSSSSSNDLVVSQSNTTLQQISRAAQDERTTILSPDESLLQQQAENDCLMLLNRHHQHHTHAKHHEHSQPVASNQQVRSRRPANYGSAVATVNGYGSNNNNNLTLNDKIRGAPNTRIVVDEIRITSGLEIPADQWPRSLKLLLFTIILALVLIYFDMNVLGMLSAIKVFRATSTGALLYVAFFIMLPQKPANCNSCKEEEI